MEEEFSSSIMEVRECCISVRRVVQDSAVLYLQHKERLAIFVPYLLLWKKGGENKKKKKRGGASK